MATASFDLGRVQRIRKLVMGLGILAVVAVAVLTQSLGGETDFHEGLEAFGLALIAICIVGRAWCSLYIGGRKKDEIVNRGPYSVSRNPLYVFSFIGAFGVGAQTGSISLAVLFLALTVAVFWFTVKREDFVPAAMRDAAYIDPAIPLENRRSLASPLVHGKMLAEAAPKATDKVLLVGDGAG